MSREFKTTTTMLNVTQTDIITVRDLKSTSDNIEIDFSSILNGTEEDGEFMRYSISFSKDTLIKILNAIDENEHRDYSFMTKIHVFNIFGNVYDEYFDGNVEFTSGYNFDNEYLVSMGVKIYAGDHKEMHAPFEDGDGKKYIASIINGDIVYQSFDWANMCYIIMEDMKKAEDFRKLIFG